MDRPTPDAVERMTRARAAGPLQNQGDIRMVLGKTNSPLVFSDQILALSFGYARVSRVPVSHLFGRRCSFGEIEKTNQGPRPLFFPWTADQSGGGRRRCGGGPGVGRRPERAFCPRGGCWSCHDAESMCWRMPWVLFFEQGLSWVHGR